MFNLEKGQKISLPEDIHVRVHCFEKQDFEFAVLLTNRERQTTRRFDLKTPKHRGDLISVRRDDLRFEDGVLTEIHLNHYLPHDHRILFLSSFKHLPRRMNFLVYNTDRNSLIARIEAPLVNKKRLIIGDISHHLFHWEFRTILKETRDDEDMAVENLDRKLFFVIPY